MTQEPIVIDEVYLEGLRSDLIEWLKTLSHDRLRIILKLLGLAETVVAAHKAAKMAEGDA